jgi:hypothetical protein
MGVFGGGLVLSLLAIFSILAGWILAPLVLMAFLVTAGAALMVGSIGAMSRRWAPQEVPQPAVQPEERLVPVVVARLVDMDDGCAKGYPYFIGGEFTFSEGRTVTPCPCEPLLHRLQPVVEVYRKGGEGSVTVTCPLSGTRLSFFMRAEPAGQRGSLDSTEESRRLAA